MDSIQSFAPAAGVHETLMLGLVFAEAAVFYVLATAFHRRSINVHLAAAASCGALWQLMGYFGVDSSYYTMVYAALGVACLLAARALGIEPSPSIASATAKPRPSADAAWPRSSAATPSCASRCSPPSCKALPAWPNAPTTGWPSPRMAATIAAAVFAALVVPAANWRRFYMVAATALAAVLFLRLNMLLHLSCGRSSRSSTVVLGIGMLVASHIAKFREESRPARRVGQLRPGPRQRPGRRAALGRRALPPLGGRRPVVVGRNSAAYGHDSDGRHRRRVADQGDHACSAAPPSCSTWSS